MRVSKLGSGRGGAVITHVDISVARAAEARLLSPTAAVPGVIYRIVQAVDGSRHFEHVSEGVLELHR
jgi:hypothetical protein